jgi:hypothetical protein
MHRIVVDVQTGQVTQVELTAEEIAAIEAANAVQAVEAPAEITAETVFEYPVETPAEPSAEQ